VDRSAEGTPVGRCIVLPGTRYTPDAPLLFFAAEVALGRGWDVRQAWWDVPHFDTEAEELAWVGAELDAALEGHDGRVLVVGKSLGTLAAGRAAELRLDAAWLTPLLTEADVAGPLLSYPARQLVLIGSEDEFLDRDVLDALPGEHLLVPGDHVLRVPGDPAAMVAGHGRFVRAFDAWLAALTP
jgi:hypothetical protein